MKHCFLFLYRYLLVLLCCLCCRWPLWAYSGAYDILYCEDTVSVTITGLLKQADSCIRHNEYRKGVAYYQKVRMLSSKAGNDTTLVRYYMGMADYSGHTGDLLLYNTFMDSALHKAAAVQAASFIVYVYNARGLNAANRGAYEESLDYYNRALRVLEKHSVKDISVIQVQISIATVYASLAMYERSAALLDSIDKQLQLSPDGREEVLLAWARVNLYQRLNDSLQVERNLKLITSRQDHGPDRQVLFAAYSKLADMALRNGRLAEVHSYIDKMAAIESVPLVMRLRQYVNAANLYAREGKYEQSRDAYLMILNDAGKINSLPWQITAYSGLSDLSAAHGDYKAAFKYEKALRAVKDLLNKEEQVKNIAAIESRYRSAEKDKAITEQKLLISEQQNSIGLRNITITASFVVIVLLFVFFIMLQRSNRKKQHFKDEALRLMAREKELQTMSALMEGEEQERTRLARDIHDGIMIQFATVKMNLSAYLGTDNAVRVHLQQLDKAIASLRSTAHNLMPDVLLENGLAEAVFYFCQNVKQQVSFDLTFEMLNDIPRFGAKFELSVYRILQELIQNIVKHAAAKEAFVQIGYRDGMLHITIEDDGVGIPESAIQATKGLGIKSIKNRLQALNGTIEISGDKDHGTSIVLEFLVEGT